MDANQKKQTMSMLDTLRGSGVPAPMGSGQLEEEKRKEFELAQPFNGTVPYSPEAYEKWKKQKEEEDRDRPEKPAPAGSASDFGPAMPPTQVTGVN